jgi:nucleotide-binding universal stress UspA family protein
MKPVEKILVALDFSDYSSPTLDYAAYLAHQLGASMSIINVINRRDVEALKSLQVYPGSAPDIDQYIAESKRRREALIDKCVAEAACSGLSLERIFKVGVPAQEILGAIEETGAQLVVMGIKGRTNLADQLFGSCAARVFRRSPVPVLSVRGEG